MRSHGVTTVSPIINASAIATKQHGAALLVLMLLVVMGVLSYLLSGLNSEGFNARREKQTQEALAQAREALIGYALRYREDGNADGVYGYLPLPDLGTTRNNNAGCTLEGCDAANFLGVGTNTTVIGRLPWRTLGIEAPRDADGECLWYAVSASHKRIQPATPMNPDTIGHLDVVVANGTSTLVAALASAHDQPVAVVFAPGPALAGQNRANGADDVTLCGGNYDVANYLDPSGTTLAGVNNYLSGSTNNASAATDAAAGRKALSSGGKIFVSATNLLLNACQGNDCALAANDVGLPLTADRLFGAVRKHTYYRDDINALLDRITTCLGDEIAAGGGPAGYAKIAGLDTNACYGKDVDPRGYYPNYKEALFVARGAMQVNGVPCAGGALLFANQRNDTWDPTGEPSGNRPACPKSEPNNPFQCRTSAAERAAPANYLEGVNLMSFAPPGTTFSGAERLERVSPLQTISQDIVRCIPATPSFATVESPTLTEAGLPQLTAYDPATRTLTLGAQQGSAPSPALAEFLAGCAWTPVARAMGTGLRGYFRFRINDAGFTTSSTDGFAFAIVDGDNNGVDACGAAAQHLGYSGSNPESPFIAPPKIAFEIDTRRNSTFDPTTTDHLRNGRNDPDYQGGHVAFTYWGGETAINTTDAAPCTAPTVDLAGTCFLPANEDDNVHAAAASARTGYPIPPTNPEAPPLVQTGAGVYKLDPSLSSVPVNKDFHVRVELTRAAAPDYRLPEVRVASTANLNLTAPGGAIDNVSLFDGDLVLVKDQSLPEENGVYVWHGAAVAMTRAADADNSVELSGMAVEVRQGFVNAGSIWRQSVASPAVDTNALRWASVRVKLTAPATTNITAPGATLDGIRMKLGDRVYVKNFGVYIWNGAALPMTAAADITAGAVIQVQQGSEATAWWRFDGAGWQRLSVRTATQAPLDLNAPGATIGGAALNADDRVLVKNQSVAAQNGIYVWSGAAVPLTRATDANEPSELPTLLTQVIEGTHAGRAFRQTIFPTTGTINTDAVQFEAIDRSTSYLLEAWILPDSPSYTNMIAAMKTTTRPMSLLYPTFTPHSRDQPVIPYPFRKVRLGFSTGQRASANDRTITINDAFASWLE